MTIRLLLFTVLLCIFKISFGQFSYQKPQGSGFGYTPGTLTISDAGSAAYCIPFILSPGTSGISPNLALTYNSQGNNGMVGVGWNLQGLSAITRAGQTYDQDGRLSGITGTTNDRFALDGERLVPKNAGDSYGSDGTEYITEQQNFSKIIEHNSTQNGVSGPSYFVVYTKSGLIMEYGNSNDSRITINGSVPFYWLLNKVTDTKGNYYTISYSNNNVTGEYYPKEIDYTGNVDAKVAPYCKVVFNYERRNDMVQRYFQGSLLVSCSQRLSSVDNYYNNILVRSYKLNYQDSPDNISELVSVQEAGSDRSMHKPTEFKWTNITAQKYRKVLLDKIPCVSTDTLINLDINSNGVMDIVKFPVSGNIEIYQGTKDTSSLKFSLMPTNIPLKKDANTKYLTGDFNGDGRIDIFFYKGNTSQMYINTTPSNSSTAQFTLINNPIPINNPYPDHPSIFVLASDLNGDGRSDFITLDGVDGTNNIYFSNMIGYNSFSYYNGAPSTNALPSNEFNVAGVQPYFQDINGDGLADVLFINPKTGETHFYQNNGGIISSFTPKVNNPIAPALLSGGDSASSCAFYFIDMNGDGLPDIVYKDAVNNQLKYWINKGDFSFNLQKTLSPDDLGLVRADFGSAYFYFADFNTDGYPDILYRDTKPAGMSNGVKFYFNDGNFNLTQQALPFTSFTTGFQIVGYGNFSGKSNSDFCIASYDVNPSQSIGTPYTVKLFRGRYGYNNLLTGIKSGNGQSYHLHYDYLCNDAIYTKYEDAIYPIMDYQASHFVITKYTTDDGVGGKRSVNYKYFGARVQLNGRGFRGFSKIQSIDNNSGNVQTKIFYNKSDEWKFINSPLTDIITALSDGTIISTTHIESSLIAYSANKSYFSYASKSTTNTFEIDGSFVKSVSTSQQYDDWGNVVTNVTDYGGGLRDSLVNQYINDETKWQLGRLKRSDLFKKAPGLSDQLRSSLFGYDRDGLLNLEVTYPDSSERIKVTKTYIYDAFGNIVQNSVSGWNGKLVESRTITTTFDSLGRFVTQIINPLSQTVRIINEPLLGHVVAKIDINGLISKLTYDGFGRLVKSQSSGGNWSVQDFVEVTDTSGMPPHCSYFIIKQSFNTPVVKEYYDVLDREIRDEKIGFNGQRIFTDFSFDKNGYLIAQSLPYFNTKTPKYITYVYDVVGRIKKVVQPDNSENLISYQGLTTIYTNALGQKKIAIKDSKQHLLKSIDNDGNAVNYKYDAAGNITDIIDANGNDIVFAYDAHGFKSRMKDPDLGLYKYVNNSFGQIIQQTDSAGNVTQVEYDLLGRPLKRTVREGVTQFTYDQQQRYGTGKMSSVTGYNGYKKVYAYDSLARIVSETQIIRGHVYKQSFTYDSLNRLKDIIYPSGFSVRRLYNANGYLSQIVDGRTKRVYWTSKALNAAGQIEAEQFGNHLDIVKQFDETTGYLTHINSFKRSRRVQNLNYQYDVVGNLLSRSDSILNRQEDFYYDDLNRLVKSKVSGLDSVVVTYDNIGNIVTKSDVGKYNYASTSGHPRKLVSITNDGKTIPYEFDAAVEYNSFQKVSEITKGDVCYKFEYNSDQQRNYKEVFCKKKLVLTKVYVNAFMEQEITRGDTTTSNYITSPEGVFAVFTKKSNCSFNKLQYCLKDNLNSLIMLTNRNGRVIARYNFDAWGNRRNSDWSKPLRDRKRLFKERGFTGQEHYEIFDLVDLNGRLYDPHVGRFLTADPSLQDITDLQGLNRFSYAGNNPLKYVDPTGYSFFGDIWHGITGAVGGLASAIAGGFSDIAQFTAHVASVSANWVAQNWQTIAIVAVAVGVTVLTGGTGASALTLLGSIGSGAAVGFATATVSTLLSGGNLGTALSAGVKGAIIGGITAGATFEVGEVLTHATTTSNLLGKVLSHGTIQGVASLADGGKFIHGFYAGAITPIGTFATSSLSSGLEQVVAASIIGGTTSELGGGKFANGAVSAAFVEMYNENGGAVDDQSDKAKGMFENAELGGEMFGKLGTLKSFEEYNEGFEAGGEYFGYAMTVGEVSIDLANGHYGEAAWDLKGAAIDYVASKTLPEVIMGVSQSTIGVYFSIVGVLFNATPTAPPALDEIPERDRHATPQSSAGGFRMP